MNAPTLAGTALTPPFPALPGGPAADIMPGLVWAFRIHADGIAEELPVDQPIEDRHDGWLWLHFNLADARACLWLASADLPPAAIELLRSPDNHQRLHTTDTCVYGVFADVVRQFDHSGDETGHLHFAMTERHMISGRRHPLHAIEATRRTISGGRPLAGVAALLEAIVEHIADAIDATADSLAEELDRIEDQILTGRAGDERQRLGQVRRTTVRLHRQLSGLRVVFHRLERSGTDSLSPALRIATAGLVQRLDGLDHEVIGMRDRAHLLQEEIGAKLAEETNRHLHMLAILTAFLLPPTLVAGIFGMNTKGLPGTESETGFLWAMAAVVASSALAYWIMRRTKVIG
jgi:zinc transporter